MLKGEIDPKFFRVQYFEAVSAGFKPILTKYFSDRDLAQRYIFKLFKKPGFSIEPESCDFIEIRNEKDEQLDLWRIEDGSVIHDFQR